MRNNDQGIAIGPILFVVAILGILAAAIAAGSGSFTGSTQTESAKTKAAAIVQMGQNLKFGWDRIIANGIEPVNVVIDRGSTTNNNHLFAPSGGGITPPSNAVGLKAWCYNNESGLIVAILEVSATICPEINRITLGSTTIPSMTAFTENCSYEDNSGLPYSDPSMKAYCGFGAIGNRSGYLFFQVLYP